MITKKKNKMTLILKKKERPEKIIALCLEVFVKGCRAKMT